MLNINVMNIFPNGDDNPILDATICDVSNQNTHLLDVMKLFQKQALILVRLDI